MEAGTTDLKNLSSPHQNDAKSQFPTSKLTQNLSSPHTSGNPPGETYHLDYKGSQFMITGLLIGPCELYNIYSLRTRLEMNECNSKVVVR